MNLFLNYLLNMMLEGVLFEIFFIVGIVIITLMKYFNKDIWWVTIFFSTIIVKILSLNKDFWDWWFCSIIWGVVIILLNAISGLFIVILRRKINFIFKLLIIVPVFICFLIVSVFTSASFLYQNSPYNKSTEYINEGVFLLNEEKVTEAIECFDKAIAVCPNDVLAYNNKGIALSVQKKYDEALKCYEKAIKISPRDSFAYLNKGRYFGEIKKNYSEAIVMYNKAISLDPFDGEVYFYKGVAYKELGDYNESLKCLNKSLDLIPSFKERISSVKSEIYTKGEEYIRTSLH